MTQFHRWINYATENFPYAYESDKNQKHRNIYKWRNTGFEPMYVRSGRNWSSLGEWRECQLIREESFRFRLQSWRVRPY